MKSLVVAGDIWEFNGSKRLLQNVVDIVFIHISKDSIVRKMAPLLSSFTALKAIRLLENYLESLKEVKIVHILHMLNFKNIIPHQFEYTSASSNLGTISKYRANKYFEKRGLFFFIYKLFLFENMPQFEIFQ